MRRIVLEQNEVISLCEVDNRSFVGIQWESGQKCMIIRTIEGYCSISNDHTPNIMNVWYADSIQEYVTRALNQGNNTNSRAYAFNNTKELCEWMSI
jgi:hypothetical protein